MCGAYAAVVVVCFLAADAPADTRAACCRLARSFAHLCDSLTSLVLSRTSVAAHARSPSRPPRAMKAPIRSSPVDDRRMNGRNAESHCASRLHRSDRRRSSPLARSPALVHTTGARFTSMHSLSLSLFLPVPPLFLYLSLTERSPHRRSPPSSATLLSLSSFTVLSGYPVDGGCSRTPPLLPTYHPRCGRLLGEEASCLPWIMPIHRLLHLASSSLHRTQKSRTSRFQPRRRPTTTVYTTQLRAAITTSPIALSRTTVAM